MTQKVGPLMLLPGDQIPLVDDCQTHYTKSTQGTLADSTIPLVADDQIWSSRSMPLVDVHDGTDRNSMVLVHVADVDGVDNNPMVDDDPMVDSMTPRVGVDHDADGDNHR